MDSGLSNDFLYAAVRIVVHFGNGVPSDCKVASGTGFFVSDDAGQLALVSNRHVVDLEYSDPRHIGLHLQPERVEVELRGQDAKTGQPDRHERLLLRNPTIRTAEAFANDVACILHTQVENLSGAGNTVVDYCVPKSLLATQEEFDTGRFVIGDMVGFPGYPEWFDERNFRPILRTGTLASDPRYPYEHGSITGDCLAYEAFSYGGSSGSPIFAFQRGLRAGRGLVNPAYRDVRVVGINAGHLKVESDRDPSLHRGHSGISYMFRSTAILALLDAAVR